MSGMSDLIALLRAEQAGLRPSERSNRRGTYGAIPVGIILGTKQVSSQSALMSLGFAITSVKAPGNCNVGESNRLEPAMRRILAHRQLMRIARFADGTYVDEKAFLVLSVVCGT